MSERSVPSRGPEALLFRRRVGLPVYVCVCACVCLCAYECVCVCVCVYVKPEIEKELHFSRRL